MKYTRRTHGTFRRVNSQHFELYLINHQSILSPEAYIFPLRLEIGFEISVHDGICIVFLLLIRFQSVDEWGNVQMLQRASAAK